MPLYIDHWLDRAEPDFYMMFVAAWIPFNAWYKKEIAPHTTNGTDAQCISYMCSNPNNYKDRIMYYLRDNGFNGQWMRSEIAALQRMLILHPIPDAASPLNFSSICVESNVCHCYETDYRRCHYKWEHINNPVPPQKKFQCVVVDTHAVPQITKLSLGVDRWSVDDLTSHPDYMALESHEMKEKVLIFFNEINPKKPLDVIKVSHPDGHGGFKIPPHSRAFDNIQPPICFDEDNEKVAKVLINLIYKLRCQIFHGSLDPNRNNMEVYEHAYNIQRKLIKALV